jgi:hypothetical protein
MPRKKTNYKIAVIDFETDKFVYGRMPRPFAVEFLCDDNCAVFWGDDCAEQLMNWLEQQTDTYMIFAHNGGKFDFWFIHSYVSNPIRIINSRIVSAKLFHHTLRDSYAIIPVPLAAYNKIKIDYDKFERHRREKHKVEILRYLHQDCVDLLTLVSSFVERFTAKLTVGSTAMTQLRKFHEFSRSNETEDTIFRQFYFGGRVQVFRSGISKGPWRCYDINSSYPKSMRDYLHPVNGKWDILDNIPRNSKRPYFVHFTGKNRGALPVKTETGELSFTSEQGEFFTCSHEFELARELGLIEVDTVHVVYQAQEAIGFGAYVDHFYAEKVAAQKASDKIGELFAKFMLNSAYGKFGQNPDKYKDWIITHSPIEECQAESDGFELTSEFADFNLFSKPAEVRDASFFDVAIAASITSASRAQLLAGLQMAEDPIYCDTDSIICRSFAGKISSTELGAWKLEKNSEFTAIAGKKLYAMYNKLSDEKPVKIASKGGALTHRDIANICKGETVEYANPAPNFSLHGRKPFQTRRFATTC